jgi:hypothetical protein
VNGRNGRLQSVGTEPARSKRAFGQRDAFGDLVPVPRRTILLLQQDQISVARCSGGSNMSSNRPITSGSGSRPSRSLPRRNKRAIPCNRPVRTWSRQSCIVTVDLRGAAYAASRISSTLRGSTNQFGWLQAPATIRMLVGLQRFSEFPSPTFSTSDQPEDRSETERNPT